VRGGQRRRWRAHGAAARRGASRRSPTRPTSPP
jgi:hypothetical protein